MSTPDLHQLTGAYAVDALDPDERAQFEAHLLTCADCRQEVAELHATAARLASLSAETPPASLRERVLAQAAATRQATPEAETAEPSTEADVSLPVVEAPRSSTIGWRSRYLLPVAAALLGVLAISFGAFGLHQRDRANELADRAGLVTSVLTAPDATSSSASVGTGRASVVVSPSTGEAVLVGTGLAMPADGKVYELWRVDAAGHPQPAGTYLPSSDGSVAVPVDGSIADTAAVAVTVEPSGGSQRPTSSPLAAFTLPT